MQIGVFDDDPSALEEIKRRIEGLEHAEQLNIEGVDCFDSPPAEDLKKYDVILMDIEWAKEKNGIDYAGEIYQKYPCTQIIFVTGYNDRFSQDIFLTKSNLCGYLVKPIDDEKLEALLAKAKDRACKNKPRELAVQMGAAVELIKTDYITHIESRAHQLIIHLLNQKLESISVYAKLDDYAAKLGEDFVRAHKSYLVNAMHIRRMEYGVITLKNGVEIPVSKRNANSAREQFFNYMKGKMG